MSAEQRASDEDENARFLSALTVCGSCRHVIASDEPRICARLWEWRRARRMAFDGIYQVWIALLPAHRRRRPGSNTYLHEGCFDAGDYVRVTAEYAERLSSIIGRWANHPHVVIAYLR